ncbi:RNA-directed DNA polymerase from mobile element jockey, partial [Stegodyphus mimosarum]
MLANHLEEQLTPNEFPCDTQFIEFVNHFVNEWLNAHTARTCPIFTTPHEIIEIIRKLKNRKAPGHDALTNITIKHFPNNIICRITSIFNACIENSYFPDCWKTAKVILLPKPGKDHTRPDGYRPISLLPGLGKVFERVILQRLQVYYDELPKEQFGFQKGLSTVKQLVRLSEFIGNALHNKESIALLMLDVAKAFDRVWHEGLIFKLINFNFDREIIKLIYSFIVNRKFFVSIGEEVSELKEIKASVPQGSILGPVIFLFYVADFPYFNLSRDYYVGCYADDTALAVRSRRAENATRKLQDFMPLVEDWCRQWRIAINAQKSQLLIIRRRFAKENFKGSLKLFNEDIPIVQKANYLGVVLNSSFTWKDHIKHITHKTISVIQSLTPLIGRYSKLDLYKKRLIFTSIIRPIMTYASPAWIMYKKNDLKKLQVIQNKYLRTITGDLRYMRV